MEKLTDADLKFLSSLQNRGFAVCIFTPQELTDGKCHRRVMENFLAEEGNGLLSQEVGDDAAD